MIERLPEPISLPTDAGPHTLSNIEWWYEYAYLTGDRGGQYAVMASFFRVGETACKKGHYLIFTLIDLDKKEKQSYSLFDANLRLQMLSFYLPFYLLLHPTDTQMWKLYKNLLLNQIPPEHSQFKAASIQKNQTKLIYGENELAFFGEKQDRFTLHLKKI
ncbi:hypothetical protein [Halobacillus mangrovi]|uniref:Uncharacterized protein n=1 Tax=Halobacillus mangrovi TaxID=402384 RepID=A0A1W5ZR03_9BACI|nr:hypothetical protein [Halobacillus mangrovi]ARI75716.1 hypothetical protein HM131_02225 [Halobacillus mangrovi]